jgi:predicted ABC-type ATPase
MKPTLCIIGGCNGAGKTTLARELLPRLGLMRFLNADEIARGLSPLDPNLTAFKAGRILLEEARSLLGRGENSRSNPPSAAKPTSPCSGRQSPKVTGWCCTTS